MNYTMHGTKSQGFTIKAVTDLTVRLLREEGSQAYVTEPKAEHLGNNIWRVSYTVVINRKQNYCSYLADINEKTVRPENKNARDLWGGE